MKTSARLRRLERLMRVLASKRDGATIAQIIKGTACSRATVYRDLELLRDSGHTLHVNTVNGEARYTAAKSELATQTMSPRERSSLMLARRSLAGVEGTWIARELDALLQSGRAVEASTSAVEMRLGLVSYDPKILETLHEAAAQQRMLRIRYRGAGDAAAHDRTIHPVRILVTDQQPYLIAWDETKRQMRTFKAARVRAAKMLRSKCRAPSEALAPRTHGAQSVKVWNGDPVDVRIRLTAEAARFLPEWPLVPEYATEPGPGGSIDLVARVAGLVETMRWTLRWGKGAEVIAPAELRELVADELRGALARYEREGGRSTSAKSRNAPK